MMWKYIKRYWAGAVLVLAVAVIGYGISRSSSFQTCQAHHQQYAAYQEHQEGPLAFKWVWRNAKVLVRCAADFTDANHGPLTALGTILLAIFTTTLWWATRTLVRHSPQIERAYISAGGARQFKYVETSPGSRQFNLIDSELFEFHVNNYGKTQGKIYLIGWQFCEEGAIPPNDPVYTTEYFDSRINPGTSSLRLKDIPIPKNLKAPVIYGRVYYETIFGRRFSSGFLYRIPARFGGSESIVPPILATQTNGKKGKAARRQPF
jgi:hypothetical protein